MLRCPNCDSKDVVFRRIDDHDGVSVKCENCGYKWKDTYKEKQRMPGLTLFIMSVNVSILLLAVITVIFFCVWMKRNGLI